MVLALVARLSALGVLTIGCWWTIHSLGDVRGHLGTFYGWFGAAFALYLAALWCVRTAEQRALSSRHIALVVGFVIFVGVVSRLLVVGTTPTLSDDIYRYRWDGLVQRAGIDPYVYAPNHPALDHLRDEQTSAINFPHLRTVYPPLTQLAFLAAAAASPSLTAQKVPFLIAEIALVAALLMVLGIRRRSLLWVAAYVWHPLPILEVAGSGHNDPLGIAMLWFGIAAWELRRYGAAAFSWALAFLSKYAAIVLVPWWWLRRTGRSQLGLFVALSVVPLLVHPTAVTAIAESLGAMAARFGSNGSVYAVLALGLGSAMAARLICGAGWVAFAWWWARREADPVRYLLGVMAVAAILSPVLHPWYLVWLIPTFCFWRPAALVALTGTVVLSYTVWPGRLATGVWEIPVWARVLEYAPVGILGLWGVWRCRWGLSHHLAVPPAAGLHNVGSRAIDMQQPPAGRPSQVVGIIIPARNEAAALGRVLVELPRTQLHEVIVVDNGSTDDTGAVARTAGVRVVTEPTPGYGRACLAGLAALSPSVDTVVFLDGDHADDPTELPTLLAPIAEGHADFVIGSRIARAEPGSLTLQQRVGNRLACWLMERRFGVRYTDLGPFRAIRRESLAHLGMQDLAFGWTAEMQAKAARARLRIVEVPVRYRRRIGRSKISGTVSGTVRAGWAIVTTILRVAAQPRSQPGGDACADC